MANQLSGNSGDLFPQAVESFRMGRPAEAETLCKKILFQNPSHSEALYLMGMVSAQTGNLNEAADRFSRAIKCNGFDARYHSSLGEVLGRMGDFDKARKAFVRALSFEPEHVGFLVNLATADLHLNQWEDAAASLEKAVSLAPKEASIHSRLGVALHQCEKFDDAVSAYRKAIDLGQKDPMTYFNLAVSLSRLDQFEDAVDAYKKAIARDPNYQGAWRSIGNIRLKQDEYEEATKYLRRAVELNPNDLEALDDLGSALAGCEMVDEACQFFEQAAALKPDAASSWASLAFAQLCAGHPDKALEASDKGLALQGNETSCLAFKSTALNHLGRRKEAAFLLGLDRLIFLKQYEEIDGYESVDAFNQALFDHVRSHPSLKASKMNRGLHQGQGTAELFVGDLVPVTAMFRDMIRSAVEDYKKAHPIDAEHPFLTDQPADISITSWATVIRDSGFLDTHFHPPGWLSGVYYPSLPEAVDVNANAHEGWIEFGREYYRIGSDDAPPVRTLQPRPGLMVLFPSYVGHRTLPFEGSQERMSVAFDILPRD